MSTLILPITTAGTHPRNGLVLPSAVLEKAVNDWNAKINKLGTLCIGAVCSMSTIATSYDTAPSFNLADASHFIKGLVFDRSLQTILAEFETMKTPKGLVLESVFNTMPDKVIPFPVSAYKSSGPLLESLIIHRFDLGVSITPYNYAWTHVTKALSNRKPSTAIASDPFSDYDRAMGILGYQRPLNDSVIMYKIKRY